MSRQDKRLKEILGWAAKTRDQRKADTLERERRKREAIESIAPGYHGTNKVADPQGHKHKRRR